MGRNLGLLLHRQMRLVLVVAWLANTVVLPFSKYIAAETHCTEIVPPDENIEYHLTFDAKRLSVRFFAVV